MINNRYLLLVLSVLPVSILLLIKFTDSPKNLNHKYLGVTTSYSEKKHPLAFFDEDTFFAGIEKAKSSNGLFANSIYGGIVPHHLYPSFIIADFFNHLAKQNPDTVILVGPNHYETGNYFALASRYSWETPFGNVEPNTELIDKLLEKKVIEIDEAVLPKDHSVAGIMPFLEYYLPNSKVVPIILSRFMTKGDIDLLSKSLEGHINKKVVIIASVDFSHYLTNFEAQERDKVTLELMKNFNYDRLLLLNNEYLDSPPSIVLLLKTMQALDKQKMQILDHTNSGQMQKNNSIETTSYFSIGFH